MYNKKINNEKKSSLSQILIQHNQIDIFKLLAMNFDDHEQTSQYQSFKDKSYRQEYSSSSITKTYKCEVKIVKVNNCPIQMTKKVTLKNRVIQKTNPKPNKQFKFYLNEIYSLTKTFQHIQKQIQYDHLEINLYTEIYISFRHHIQKHKQQINNDLKSIISHNLNGSGFTFVKPFDQFPNESLRIVEKLKKFILDLRLAICQIQKIAKLLKICLIDTVENWQQFHFKIYRNSFYVTANSGYIKYFTSHLLNYHKNCIKAQQKQHRLISDMLKYLQDLNLICEEEVYARELDIQEYNSESQQQQKNTVINSDKQKKKKRRKNKKNKNKNNANKKQKILANSNYETQQTEGFDQIINIVNTDQQDQQKFINYLENMKIYDNRIIPNLSIEDILQITSEHRL